MSGQPLDGAAAEQLISSDQNAFHFALIGDLPYASDMRETRALMQAINADDDIAFVLHAGDIKDGKSACSDAVFLERFALFSEFTAPFLLTPGDNEWTDCYRSGGNPVERLGKLREIFYASGNSDLAVIGGKHQGQSEEFPEYVENRRFERQRVLFASLHIVGSNNGLNPWKDIDADDSWAKPNGQRIREFRERQRANIQWLRNSFAEAKARNAKALFLLSQANPHFEDHRSGKARMEGFQAILTVLEEELVNFDKPVLYAHGDYHRLIIDQPWPQFPQLTRVQTYGSPWINWLKISVRPDNEEVFEIEPQIPLRHPRR